MRLLKPVLAVGILAFVQCASVPPRTVEGAPAVAGPVSGMADNDESAAIAYNPDKDEYLVVWTNMHTGGPDAVDPDIYGSLVSADSASRGAFRIANTLSREELPSVAYNAATQEYLVVWQQLSGSTLGIYGQRLTEYGNWSGGVITIATADYQQEKPAVACHDSSGHCLVVWQADLGGDWNIFTLLLAGDGSVVTAESPIISDSLVEVQSPDVAYSPSMDEYTVVWEHHVSETNWDIHGQRTDDDGGYIGDWIPIATAPSDKTEDPAVAVDPSTGQFLVVWKRSPADGNASIAGQLISPFGELPGTGELLISGGLTLSVGLDNEQGHPDVAFDPWTRSYLAVWDYDYGRGDIDVNSRRVSDDGRMLWPRSDISRLGTGEQIAAVAAGVETHLVAWQDGRDRETTLGEEIYADVMYYPGDPPFSAVDTRGAQSGLQIVNLDPGDLAYTHVDFTPHSNFSSVPSNSLIENIGSESSVNFWLPGLPELTDTLYGAAIRSEGPIAAIVRTDWFDRDAAGVYNDVMGANDVVLPLAMYDYGQRTSMISIQNLNEHAGLIEFFAYPVDEEFPVASGKLSLSGIAAHSFELGSHRPFDSIPNEFLGSIRFRSEEINFAVQSFVTQYSDGIGQKAVSAFEGVPTRIGDSFDPAAPTEPGAVPAEDSTLFAPLFRRDFYGTTVLSVANVLDRPIDVNVVYRGGHGDCDGMTYEELVNIPSLSSHIFDPAHADIPNNCAGSAEIQAEGHVAAVVLDDTYSDPADSFREQGFAIQSAAYDAISRRASSPSVALPLVRNAHTPMEFSTGIQIVNLGDASTHVDIDVTLSDGKMLHFCAPKCENELGPGESYTLWPPSKDEWPEGTLGSAQVQSRDDQPLAVIVNDYSELTDSATYNGVAFTDDRKLNLDRPLGMPFLANDTPLPKREVTPSTPDPSTPTPDPSTPTPDDKPCLDERELGDNHLWSRNILGYRKVAKDRYVSIAGFVQPKPLCRNKSVKGFLTKDAPTLGEVQKHDVDIFLIEVKESGRILVELDAPVDQTYFLVLYDKMTSRPPVWDKPLHKGLIPLPLGCSAKKGRTQKIQGASVEPGIYYTNVTRNVLNSDGSADESYTIRWDLVSSTDLINHPCGQNTPEPPLR